MSMRRVVVGCLALLLTACGEAPFQLHPAAALKPATTARQESAAKKEVPKLSVQELLEKGQRAMNAGDGATAGRLLEQVLAIEPNNSEALWRLALLMQRAAMERGRPESSPYFLRSADLIRKRVAAGPPLGAEEQGALSAILYNEACTLALYGESARAIEALVAAVNAGFDSLDQFDADSDLDSLRKLPVFQDLMRRIEYRRAVSLRAASKPYAIEFRLKTSDGKPIQFSDFRGKVVVVSYWGTWCPPARKLVPQLVRLYRRFHEKGLEVVGLAYQNEEPEAARKFIEAFVRENDVPFPCPLGDDEARNQVPGFAGYPTTLFIDRGGKVRLMLAGYQPYSALEAAAASLLSEEPETGAKKPPPASGR